MTPKVQAAWVKNLKRVIQTARNAFIPPPQETVSEWADGNRLMSMEESPTAGLWNTDNTPYLRAIMDTFTDDTTQIVSFLKSAQIGATEMGINICGYVIDRDPSRVFYVMPDEDLAKDFSKDRLQKALKNTPSIARKIEAGERGKALAIRFPGGFIRLSGANSPAKLASWAIPKVIMDEVDKYPQWTGKEASPVALVKERTKNWPWRKILVMSTPTTEWGYIYRAYQDSEAHYQYYVPCPECGHYQTLDFKHLKFPKEIDDEKLSRETYYQCCKCKHHIRDRDKMKMLRKGRWVPDEKLKFKPSTVGFKINTIYSPWVTFASVAKEFLKSKDNPSQLMNFVNSWLGEPWKSKTQAIKAAAVMERRTDVPAGFVPQGTILLTGGVDRQQGYFYWVVRAWSADMVSQNIAYGSAITFDDVRMIMDQYWKIEGREDLPGMQVILYCVDSGYDTNAVYDFCYDNYPVAVPVKGSSRPMDMRYKQTNLKPRNRNSRFTGMEQPQVLYVVDTNQYKDLIMYRLGKKVGEPGSWTVSADTTDEYAEMITSEQKVMIDGKEVWKQMSSSKPNHYLDCEVYAYAAADIMNVRYLRPAPQQTVAPIPTPPKKTGGYELPKTFDPFK